LTANLSTEKRREASEQKPPGTAIEPTSESVRRVARLAAYEPSAKLVGESAEGATNAKFWVLQLADDWTVPVVELFRGTPKGTACIVADGGRAAAIEQIQSLLDEEYRVLAIDPFLHGELTFGDRDYLFALLVSSVGARPIGVQADQMQAVTRWATSQFGKPVERNVAIGPRLALAALVATATGTENERPQQLVLHDQLSSLGEIIDKSWSIDKYPELFCFGLFEHCDIDDLVELAEPCEISRR
jgi:hypothetical protein